MTYLYNKTENREATPAECAAFAEALRAEVRECFGPESFHLDPDDYDGWRAETESLTLEQLIAGMVPRYEETEAELIEFISANCLPYILTDDGPA